MKFLGSDRGRELVLQEKEEKKKKKKTIKKHFTQTSPLQSKTTRNVRNSNLTNKKIKNK